MIFSDWPWRHWRQVRGEAIALRLNDEQLNWRELCARVDELASGFAAQGVVEGSGVMLRAWNTPQTLLELEPDEFIDEEYDELDNELEGES